MRWRAWRGLVLSAVLVAGCVSLTPTPSPSLDIAPTPSAIAPTIAPTGLMTELPEPTSPPEPTLLPYSVTIVNESSQALIVDVGTTGAGWCQALEPGQRVTLPIGTTDPAGGYGVQVYRVPDLRTLANQIFRPPAPTEVVILDGTKRGTIRLTTRPAPTTPYPLPSSGPGCQGG